MLHNIINIYYQNTITMAKKTKQSIKNVLDNNLLFMLRTQY